MNKPLYNFYDVAKNQGMNAVRNGNAACAYYLLSYFAEKHFPAFCLGAYQELFARNNEISIGIANDVRRAQKYMRRALSLH